MSPIPKFTTNLALQGGGSHGAFTWGVLDKLLADGRIKFDSISGTSAGAINAAILAYGYLQDKEDGARIALEKFWHNLTDSFPMAFSSFSNSDKFGFKPFSFFKNEISNYFGQDKNHQTPCKALEELLENSIDFELLQKYSPINLFIAATNSNTGQLRLFTTKDIKSEVLLASAAIPGLFPTIMIDDQPYWDGVFSANPSVFPLIYQSSSPDILIIMLQSLQFPNLPTNTVETTNRIYKLGMNASFLGEMQYLARIQKIGQNENNQGELEKKILNTHFHLIEVNLKINDLPVSSMLNPNRKLIDQLFTYGQESVNQWIDNNLDKIGRKSSIDLVKTFLN